MTHKNLCQFKDICPWVNGKLRKCGFLTDKVECLEFRQFRDNPEFVETQRKRSNGGTK